MKFDVVSFGAAVVDCFVHTDISEKKDFLCYPLGAKILIKELKFDIGGGAVNTSVAFSRLGLKTGCICGIGDDVNGINIYNFIRKENIKFLGKLNEKEFSGYSIILDSKGGERTILTYKGANNSIELKDIPYKEFSTKWLYYSSVLEKSLITQKKLAKIFHKKGTKIAFNPSLYIINKENLKDLLKITEVLILNKEEAEALCKRYKKSSKDMLKSLYELGPKIVLITDKDNPAICFDGKKKYSITPHKNIKVRERTGAGDAFSSGFVAGQIVGFSIEKSLELGLKEAESVIQYFGATNNLLKMNLKNKKC